MHNRGWRSVYCITKRDAFRGTVPINLTDRLHQVLRWATGSVEIFFSRNNPLLATRRLKFLQRIAYLNVGFYPFTSLFLVTYCFLPALSLFSGQFIVQGLNIAFLFYLLIITLTLTFLSLLEGLLKVIAGIEISFTLTSKSLGEDEDDIYAELYLVKWTSLFIMPLTIIIVNLLAIVIGLSRTIYSVIPQWTKLLGGLFFSIWVLCHMYPFAKGLMGRRGRVPTIVYVWSSLVSITVSLLWISISPPDGNTSSSAGGGSVQCQLDLEGLLASRMRGYKVILLDAAGSASRLPSEFYWCKVKDQKENDRPRNLLHLHSEATLLLQVLDFALRYFI
ncbi:hypothetical protein CRYUN_Cryun36dG0039600 [Craigia yunnanensis]